MPNITDGVFTSPIQDGAKRILYPLAEQGDYYSQLIERNYVVAATAYVSAAPDRASYTNLLTYSEQLDNAAWTKIRTTVSANTRVSAFDGSISCDSIFETTDNNNHQAVQNYTFSAASYTLSGFFRGIGRDWMQLNVFDGTNVHLANFNISTGQLGSTFGVTSASIVGPFGGMYRVIMNFTASAGAGTPAILTAFDGLTTSYVGDPAKGLFVFGMQLTQAASGAPYIANTAATRSVTVPTVDPDNPVAFLVQDGPVEETYTQLGYYKFRRFYAMVPPTLAVDSTILVNRPEIPITPFPGRYGDWIVDQPETTVGEYDVYNRHTVTSDTGVPSFYPTGGNYTLSFSAATTATISFSATAGAVDSAIDLLTPVINRGGVSVSGTYNSAGGFTVTFVSYSAATASVASLLGLGGGGV